MNRRHLELGAVYQATWTPEPVRVVAYDSDVVMYDTWWSHKQSWAMAKLNGTFAYYRVHRPFFESHSSFKRLDAYTQQEGEVHRPDLPFSFGQDDQLSWYERWEESDAQSWQSENTLNASAIYLAPFGPRDGDKPSVLLQAANGCAFSVSEVLRLAHAVQAPFLGEARLTAGIGIYRCGIKKRLPSYYIWGGKSRLDSPR